MHDLSISWFAAQRRVSRFLSTNKAVRHAGEIKWFLFLIVQDILVLSFLVYKTSDIQNVHIFPSAKHLYIITTGDTINTK